MFISYRINVREICTISNKFIKFIKKLQKTLILSHSYESNQRFTPIITPIRSFYSKKGAAVIKLPPR
nr:MAG TPA: hypothetical protein [Caudoviricetes sp.]